jgi:energy-coupling factor transport system permease protein
MTFIHQLHPLVKMGTAFGLTLLAMTLDRAEALGLLVVFLLAVLAVARVRLGLRAVLITGAFLGVASGVNYLVERDAGYAAHYALRVAAVLLCMPVLAATTAPQDTVRALARCRVPHGLTVALMLVWRFFPVLSRESNAIRAADRLRGHPVGRARRGWTRVYLVPMAFVAVDYADRVALALELRGFDPAAERTWYRVPQVGWRDAVFLVVVSFLIVAASYFQWGRASA